MADARDLIHAMKKVEAALELIRREANQITWAAGITRDPVGLAIAKPIESMQFHTFMLKGRVEKLLG